MIVIRSLINEFYYRIKISFETKEDFTDHVKISCFKEVLSEFDKLTEKDIDAIVNPLCLPFLKFQRINFKAFLKFEEFYKQEFNILDEDRVDEKEELCPAIEVFKIMKDIGEKYGYDKYLLFSLFDKNDKGFITPAQVFTTFKEIGLSHKYD